MSRFKKLISILLVTTLVFNMSLFNLAEDIDSGTFLIESSGSTLSSDVEVEETIETTKEKEFIEETSEGLDINDYEKEVLRKIYEMEDESTSIENEEPENDETNKTNVLESLVADIVLEKVDSSSETTVEEETTTNVAESENMPLQVKLKMQRQISILKRMNLM